MKEKVFEFRKKELTKLEENMKRYQNNNLLFTLKLCRNRNEVLKEEKESEMLRIKEAFGIREDAKEGDAFKFESEKDRQEKLARYAEEERTEKRKRLRDR